jgi:DNA polymerase type B, organellar and viral
MARRAEKRPIYTLDAETDPFKPGRIPAPFLWGLYEGDSTTYREFATAQDVATYLRDRRAIVYAHNGGRFDYHYLRPFIDPDTPFMVIAGRIAKFRIGDCEFRDSMNLLPGALARYEKEKIDYSIMEPGTREIPRNRERIREYLRSDCLNLYRYVSQFIERYGLHLTQASAAFRFWSKTFSVKIPRQSEARYRQLKPYYYGGRVQCFASGNLVTDFRVVDRNSAYPDAMKKRKHPYSTMFDTKLGLPKGDALGPCMVRVKAISKGALPMRLKHGELFYPCDERTVREYFVTGWEILAGLETQTLRITQIIECHVFAETIGFSDYVDHFFEIRKKAKAEGDKAGDHFAKIFLNALYGKFASNPEKYSEQLIATPESVERWEQAGFSRNTEWEDRTLMVRPLPPEKRRYFNVATAASITGSVRADLWRDLQACGEPLYCDTDSIAARDVSALAIGSELGQWKVERECDEFAIAGPKNYAFHERGRPRADADAWKIASKGSVLTWQEMVRLCAGETVIYQPAVPTYSVHKSGPAFVPRSIRRTYKDVSILGEAA